MKRICDEWHLGKELIEKLAGLVSESNGYYKACDDYYYVAKGNVSDIFRILDINGKVFVLEFYVVD